MASEILCTQRCAHKILVALVPGIFQGPSSGGCYRPLELATAQRPTPLEPPQPLEPGLGFAAFGPIAAAHLADPGIDPLDRYMALSKCDAAKRRHMQNHQRILSTRDSELELQQPRLEDPNRRTKRIAASCRWPAAKAEASLFGRGIDT